MSLLNFDDPQQAGLLAFAQNMFAAGAPQTRRVGIGEGLSFGLNGMQKAQQAAEQARRQKQEEEMMLQMKQMQFGQMQQKMQEQKATEDAMVNYAKFKQGGAMPASKIDAGEFYRAAQKYGLGTDNDSLNKIVSLVNQGGYSAESAAAALSGKNVASPSQPSQQQEQAQMPQGFSKGDLVKAQIGELVKQAQFYGSRPDAQSQMLAQQAQAQVLKLANDLPKFANDYRVGKDKKGNLVNVRLADDGSEQYSPTQVAEKLHFGDNGKQLLGIDQYTGKSSVISDKFQTLDSIASNETARRGQDLVNSRALDAQNRPTWNSDVGAFISPPTKDKPQGQKIDLAGYAKPDKPLTEVQAKAVTFASRMNNANQILNDLSSKGINKSSAGKSFLEEIPLVGGGLGNLYNATLDDGTQKLDQAKRDWVNANLRNESGAAIGVDEFVNADKQYFPQIGDKAEVIKQKAINRKLAEDGMRSQAGSGAKYIDSIVSGGKANEQPAAGSRTVVKTGMYKGRKVIQYSDGSVDYGN